MPNLTITLGPGQYQEILKIAQHLGTSPEELANRSIEDYCTRLREEEIEVRAMYPHMARVFGPAGWDDPEMDSYNALDPRPSF
jgi:hypothetical protein